MPGLWGKRTTFSGKEMNDSIGFTGGHYLNLNRFFQTTRFHFKSATVHISITLNPKVEKTNKSVLEIA